MSSDDLKADIEELRFAAPLPPAIREQLAAAAHPVELRAGETLFREAADIPNIYLVCSGRVNLEMRVPGRGSVTILSLGPGDLCGVSNLLGIGPMTATARAVEPSRLLAIPVDDLLARCEQDYELGYHLMRQLATAVFQRLVATRLQLLDLFAQAEESRPT